MYQGHGACPFSLRPQFPCLQHGDANLPHGAVAALLSAWHFTFLPSRKSLQERASSSAPTGTRSLPCLVKAGPLPPPSHPPSVLSSDFSPGSPRAPRPAAKPQDAGMAFRNPPPLCPLQLQPLCGSTAWGSLPGGPGPMATVVCHASTCKGIHLKRLSTVCVYLGHAEEPRAVNGAAFQNSL